MHQPRAKRVMVVDTNEAFVATAGQLISEQGFELLSVSDPELVCPRCAAERPIGALVNARLGEVSGAQLCSQLKRQDPGLPVILMLDEESAEGAAMANTSGADNYLIRPIGRDALLFCVRTISALSPLLAEHRALQTLRGEASADSSSMIPLALYGRFLSFELRRAERYGFPLAVLLIAPDPLPPDVPSSWIATLRQQLADALAQAVRACVRDIDLSTVLSPREISVMMPHTDEQGAAIVAERIRTTVAHRSYHFGRLKIGPTISIGVGMLHGEQANPPELIALARRGLEVAQRTGGNRVMTAS